MKHILVTGCGGAPTINFVRSLRFADPNRERYYIVGVDADTYTVHRSECDKNYICPKATDPQYISYILEIIRKEQIQFLHTQPEQEVYAVGKHREIIKEAGCALFMPRQETVEMLRNKYDSYEVWEKKNITVPKNIKINNEEDLKHAFDVFKNRLWLRETVGAAGKGSLSNPSYELAKAWIDYRNGWKITIAAEHLSDRTVTWQSLWRNGELIVGQGRSRLYWEMSNRTQSGVTGLTGTGKIENSHDIARRAIEVVLASDEKPHGIFSVDFTYDFNGVPNPTEINIGKFFTTHYFITKAGCNMPEMLVNLAFDEYEGATNIINPCTDDLYWVRGMDIEPILISGKQLKETEEEYKTIRELL